MGGGLLQLAAVGLLDTYITGNPQITFFKSVYRKHTNFAIDLRKINFDGSSSFGGSLHAKIIKGNNILLHKLYLQPTLPAIKKIVTNDSHVAFRWLNWVGHKLIKRATFKMNGAEIDSHTGEWIHLWNELSQKPGHKEAYAEMVGNVPGLTQISSVKGDGTSEVTFVEEYKLYIPLLFWFCRNPGLSLPLLSLKNTDIHLDIDIEEFDNLIWATEESITNIRASNGSSVFNDTIKGLKDIFLYAEYIQLDDTESRRFKASEHEYLIEIVQEKGSQNFTGTTTNSKLSGSFDLTFHYPVKELIWVIQPDQFTEKAWTQSRGGRQHFNFTDSFDYSGFSGTPSSKFGHGMPGGRSNNLLYSLPGVKLPFITNVLEPDFSKDDITTTNDGGFNTELSQLNKTTQASTVKMTGYNYISKYHKTGSTVSTYRTKTIENYLGNTSIVETVDPLKDSLGIWSNSNLNLKLLNNGVNPIKTAKIQLNGANRVEDMDGFYFNTVQPYTHHTNTPAVGINVYSFAIDPEDTNPTGTCNFSSIDQANIDFTFSDDADRLSRKRSMTMRVYALSYNLLRIKDDMYTLNQT